MKQIQILFLAFCFLSCIDSDDPYSEGAHWDYNIVVENGFVYKHKRNVTIQVLNSDATPLRVGHKIY